MATQSQERPAVHRSPNPGGLVPPDPRDLPKATIVVFDSQCRFCWKQVERLLRWAPQGLVAFLPLQDPRTQQLLPEFSHDQLMQAMVIVSPDGRRHVGASAMRWLSRHVPRLYPLAPLLHLPGSLPVWRWLYAQVAKRRYRCSEGSCDIQAR